MRPFTTSIDSSSLPHTERAWEDDKAAKDQLALMTEAASPLMMMSEIGEGEAVNEELLTLLYARVCEQEGTPMGALKAVEGR